MTTSRPSLRSFLARPAALLGALTLLAAAPLAQAQTDPSIHLTQLTNLSVRSKLTAGQTLTAGFVIAGDSNTTARILVRAVGPTLGLLGVTDAMPNPKLVLTTVTPTRTVTIANDDWSTPTLPLAATDTVSQQPIDQWSNAFALSPGTKDAALLAELKPGSYTITVSGSTPADVGTVLVEIYNVALRKPPGSARISNLSVLSFVSPDAPLLAGWTLEGVNLDDLLLRAVGPTLSQFGVQGAIADCRIDALKPDGTVYASSDNWADFISAFPGVPTLSQTTAQIGAFPLPVGSKDASIIIPGWPHTLAADGPNMVRASSVNGASGVMLLEIYEHPNQ